MKRNDFILIPTFTNSAWLEKNSRQYHLVFVASFTKDSINSQEICIEFYFNPRYAMILC
jgi:hypothetical protein